MAGRTYSDLKPRDHCWVIVDGVNYPTGYWRAVVQSVEPQDGWNRISALINDGGVPKEYDGREPYANYLVVPSSKDIDSLVTTIGRLEETLARTRTDNKLVVDTLTAALAYAAKLSPEDLKGLIERK